MHFFNKNNDDLVKELKEKGIIDKNILNSIKSLTDLNKGNCRFVLNIETQFSK